MTKFLFLILLPAVIGLLSQRNSLSNASKQLMAESSALSEPILKSLVRRISTALEISEVPIWIHEVKSFNGLATADGRIFITRGTLDAFYAGKVTAEELSSIVAHELGHVALGHGKRRMLDFSMQNALRIILSLTLGRLLPAIGIYVANLLSSLVAAKLSRNDEFEADAYAAALLSKAGIGTNPQITLLKKLDSLTKVKGSAPQWLLSHPRVDDRVKAIEDLSASWKTKSKS